MRKQLLCAALLAVGMTCAHAAQTTWNYTYQGFINADTGVFDPNVRLTGTFIGEDNNADGFITYDELTYLASGRVYLEPQPYPSTPGDLNPSGGCVQAPTSYASCTVSAFSYKLTGQLEYSLSYSGHDEFYQSWYSNTVTGNYFNDGGSNPPREQYWETRYNWSNQTTFTISPAPAPVPEPSAALLLPAGLGVLLAARRRRQKVAV